MLSMMILPGPIRLWITFPETRFSWKPVVLDRDWLSSRRICARLQISRMSRKLLLVLETPAPVHADPETIRAAGGLGDFVVEVPLFDAAGIIPFAPIAIICIIPIRARRQRPAKPVLAIFAITNLCDRSSPLQMLSANPSGWDRSMIS